MNKIALVLFLYTFNVSAQESLPTESANEFQLTCSRLMTFTLPNSTEPPVQADPLVFLVQPDSNLLLNSNKKSIGIDVLITDSNISFNDVQAKSKAFIKYRVSRITGALSGEVFIMDILTGRFTGNCEKSNGASKKF